MNVLTELGSLLSAAGAKNFPRVPEILEPNLSNFVQDKAGELLAKPELLRAATFALRQVKPTVVVGRFALATRFADVVEILENERYFHVVPIYADAMTRTTGAFILGMDDHEAYDREAPFLRSAVRPGDLERIRSIVRQRAEGLLDAAAAEGVLDAASGYAHKIALALVAEYFGVRGPDETTMTRWMRAIFWDLFLNLGNRTEVSEAATAAAKELNAYLEKQADELRAGLKSGASVPDHFFARLVQSQSRFSIDDLGVRRNIAGVIVGAVDTLSKAIVHALDQLLRRPAELAKARSAALADRVEEVADYAFEALRFNPHNPIIVRHCAEDFRLARGTEREVGVPAGTTVWASTLSAMFDASVVEAPHQFRVGRAWGNYIHFGRGMHRCFGELINRVVIPEAVRAVLLRPVVRPMLGWAGRIAYDGPFPVRMVVSIQNPNQVAGGKSRWTTEKSSKNSSPHSDVETRKAWSGTITPN
jgi:cytochrome P450